MKKKRFSIEQIVAALKQAELGMPVTDLIRQVGISEQTFYRWKKQYAGMQSDQVRELKHLQEENAWLKKLVTELSLDKVILQDVASKSGPARVEALSGGLHRVPLWIEHTTGLQVDQASAHVQHYKSGKYRQDALRGRTREIVQTRVRYAYGVSMSYSSAKAGNWRVSAILCNREIV